MENVYRLSTGDVSYLEKNNEGVPICRPVISFSEASKETLDTDDGENVAFSTLSKRNVRYRAVRIRETLSEGDRRERMKDILHKLSRVRSIKDANLISILGIYVNVDEPLAFVSATSSITVLEYLETNLGHDRRLCVLDIAKGLDHLHRNGIVHGAVRGSNVLVNPDNGSCILGEFAYEHSPSPQTLAYYANWIAPELVDVTRFHRLQVDHYREEYKGEYKYQSDIFALGCTAIEIYTGEPPAVLRIPYRSVSTVKDLCQLGRRVSDLERQLIPPNILSAISSMMLFMPGRRPDSGNAVTYIEHPNMFRVTCYTPVHAKTMMRRYARQAIFSRT